MQPGDGMMIKDRPMDLTVMEANAGQAADFLKSMASKPRLLILCSLLEGPRLAGDLAAMLDLAPANLSQHLTRLRDEGLVKASRQGNSMLYQLSSGKVLPFMHMLHDLFCGDGADKP